MDKRFSMCKTKPENDSKSVWHPGQVILSSEFKERLLSFTSVLFVLLLLRVKLANLSRKAAWATKESQKQWISRVFIPVDLDPMARNDLQAVASFNFDENGPAAGHEEGA